MIQYDLEVVETLVDDYTGAEIEDGWTIIRNNDGQVRHVSEITSGAFNVLAEAVGSREAAYRTAVTKLQTLLEQELQQAETDQASALLFAQQADVLLSNPPTDVVERIAEYTVSGTENPLYPVGTKVIFLSDDPGDWYDGRTGEIASLRPDDSVFDYDIRLNNADRNTIAAFSSEVVRLPETV